MGLGSVHVCYDFLQTEAVFIMLFLMLLPWMVFSSLVTVCCPKPFQQHLPFQNGCQSIALRHALQSNHSLTSFDLYVSVFTGPAGLEGFLKFFSFLKGNKVLCRILPVDLVCSLLSNPKDLYSFSSKARFFHHSPKLLSLKHWEQ